MWRSDNYTITSLCDRFNISRTTGHKLIKRFVREGENCLAIGSRNPHSTPHKTSSKIESYIIKVRKMYPNWGARKLKVILEERFPRKKSPQQNGRHERMHKDLKAYCRHRIQKTLSKQQIVMDEFVREYNTVRPHESLDMNKPINVHFRFEREFNEKIIPFVYPLHLKVIKVTTNGAPRWGAYNWVLISRAAIGLYIGTEEFSNGIWNVYYRDVLLG